MSQYTWDNTSPIGQVDISAPKKGMAAAVLHVSEVRQEEGAFSSLAGHLREGGFAVIPDTLDGKPVLRIPRVASPDALLDNLRKNGAVAGEETVQNDNVKKLTLKEKLKKNTGRIAGYGYIGGDVALAAGGIARATEGFKKEAMPKGWAGDENNKGWKDVLKGQFSTGWLWLIGGMGLGRYASEAVARKQERLLSTTSEFFRQEGVDIPEHAALHSKHVGAKRSGFKKFEDFMYRFPTEFLNFFFAVGSGFLAKEGWEKSAHTGKRNLGKIGAAIFVFLGAINGMLFKPQKVDATENQGFFGSLWNKIRENPLIVTSVAYYANNVSGFIGAGMEKSQQSALMKEIDTKIADNKGGDPTHSWHGAQKDHPTYAAQKQSILNSRAFPKIDLVVYGFYGVANAALMKTSKGGGGGHGASAGAGGDAASVVYAAAAEVLTTLPEEKRAEILPKLAEHLRKARGLSPFAEDIDATLREKVAGLQSHPLLAQQKNSAPAPEPPSPARKETAHRERITHSRTPDVMPELAFSF